nr:hypothetical protein Iba_chr13aCG6590 [Ipomoea batatas]GMD76060.1 hypothetical protein Iba_chr13bCG6690 [Ipomoea batatas]
MLVTILILGRPALNRLTLSRLSFLFLSSSASRSPLATVALRPCLLLSSVATVAQPRRKVSSRRSRRPPVLRRRVFGRFRTPPSPAAVRAGRPPFAVVSSVAFANRPRRSPFAQVNKEIKESRIRATSKVPVRHKYLMSKVHQEKITWLR